jgi:hypothetical protein
MPPEAAPEPLSAPRATQSVRAQYAAGLAVNLLTASFEQRGTFGEMERLMVRT